MLRKGNTGLMKRVGCRLRETAATVRCNQGTGSTKYEMLFCITPNSVKCIFMCKKLCEYRLHAHSGSEGQFTQPLIDNFALQSIHLTDDLVVLI